jgi:transposase
MYIKRSKIKTKTGNEKEYLSLTESYRENGKIKQRTILQLGCANNLKQKEIEKMIYGLSKLTEHLRIIDNREINDPDIQIHKSKNFGIPLVINHFWKELQMDKISQNIQKQHPQLEFDFETTFKSAIIQRLIQPGSERAMLDWFKDVYLPGTEKFDLQHLYRSVTLVSKHQTEIEEHLFDAFRTLFGIDCSIVFYDTTSTYFEGDGIDKEALKQYGHSKDHRPDRKQIKVGIVMSRDGIPICPQIFAGNESDVATIPQVLEKLENLKKDHTLTELIFVGDSGMISKENKKSLEEKKMKYILGARMRNSNKIRDYVISEGIKLKDKKQQEKFKIKDNLFATEVFIEGIRYILCYNPSEAKKDKISRENVITKLREDIASSPKKYLKNKLQKRFLKITNTCAEIDEEKMKEEEKYDGMFVIETNTDVSAEEVTLRYKDLILVEHAFRCLKSTIDVRPIYHRTSENIQGHIFISYLSLCFFCLLIRELEKNQQELPCEEHHIIPSLSRILAHNVTLFGKKFVLLSEIDGINRKLLASLGIKRPQRVIKQNW